MHKFAILLIGILGILLLGEKECPHSAYTSASAITVDRAAEKQWLCEQHNNSDLTPTRIICEVAAPTSITLLGHNYRNESGRVLHRQVAGLENTLSERVKKSHNHSILSAVVRVADRYIYRLRRLII